MPVSLQEELLHYAEYLQDKYTQNQSSNNVTTDLRQAWHEAMTGQTIPVSELWEEFEDE